MRVISFNDPADFAAAASRLLLAREAENNLLFGLLERLDPADAVLRVVRQDDQVVAAALQTDPAHNLLLSHGPQEAFDLLADSLGGEGIRLPGVQGSSPAVENFAAQWARLHNLTGTRRMALGVYRLTRVIAPPPVPGELYIATLEDLPIVVRFRREFCEAIGDPDQADPQEICRRGIAKGSIHLWKIDDEPICAAACQG